MLLVLCHVIYPTNLVFHSKKDVGQGVFCWKYSRLGAIAERGGESVIKTFLYRNIQSIDIKHLYYCIYDNLKDKTFITS